MGNRARKARALPWTRWGPRPQLALRGGSVLYWSCRTVDWAGLLGADANLGTNKMGSGAYGPSGVQGQSPGFLNVKTLPTPTTPLFIRVNKRKPGGKRLLLV